MDFQANYPPLLDSIFIWNAMPIDSNRFVDCNKQQKCEFGLDLLFKNCYI